MKVLIITNTFPPISGSHVQRMLKMANVLAKENIQVGVLTYEIEEKHPLYDESLVDVIDPRIKVFRAPIGFLHKSAYSTFKEESDAHYNKVAESSNFIKKMIYRIVTKGKKTLLFPDTMIDWYYAVMSFEKRTKTVKHYNPDIIISCSQPNTVHLIGYKLSKKYNISHFLDYADPWVYLGDYGKVEKTHRFKKSRRMEKKIIDHSVGVSFSAPGCRDLYIDKYRIDEKKTSVSMSGFEVRLLDKAARLSVEHNSELVSFIYGGALHEYVRNPKPFFNAAKYFEHDIDVVIRTDNIGQAQNWLQECGDAKCIKLKPYLAFDDYFEEMLSKDVILFFGNKNDVQIPGKIFNCIATGKYILYIKANNEKQDTVETIITAYGRGTVVDNSENSIQDILDYLVKNKNEVREKYYLEAENIMQFSDEQQYANLARHLKQLMKENESMVNVIGLGYIGLPTALMMASYGVKVVGTDCDEKKVATLNSHRITFKEQGLEELFLKALKNGIVFSCEYQTTETYIVSVPTPYDKFSKKVDPQFVITAVKEVLKVAPNGATIVIESTVSPGTIDKYIRSEIASAGFLVGKDINLVHAPERIIPGNMVYELIHNNRTIGADDKIVGEKVKKIYSSFCQGEITVTDIKTAEMTKVVENTYRAVNIAFANELAKICRHDNLNVYEIINICNKHPRVNILQPGPGVGGHCISVDPWFLVGDYPSLAKVIDEAMKTNDGMPDFVLNRVYEIMKENNMTDISRVGLYGLTYKENVDDMRESPTLQLLESQQRHLATGLKVYDPFIRDDVVPNQYHDIDEFIDAIDFVVIMVKHDEIKQNMDKLNNKIVLDCHNICTLPNVYHI